MSKLAATTITKGFYAACAYNILGILFFSKGFTNTGLAAIDPAVFSWSGQVSIVLWGIAYGSIAKSYHSVPYLVLLFFVEKMVYAITWLVWLSKNAATLPTLFAQDPLSAMFFSVYGSGDILFGLFFAYVGWTSLQTSSHS